MKIHCVEQCYSGSWEKFDHFTRIFLFPQQVTSVTAGWRDGSTKRLAGKGAKHVELMPC